MAKIDSKNNKFHKILHLEREKVKKGFEIIYTRSYFERVY